MKSVTEFPNFKLLKGLETVKALTTEGKTPEEIQTTIGEAFKLEGDKIKFFINAVEVAGQNLDKLSRVMVVTFAENEKVPEKATKVEEHYYVPEFYTGAPKPVQSVGKGGAGKPKQPRDGGGKPKSSPWGLSPDEIAAKKAASLKAQAEKAKKA